MQLLNEDWSMDSMNTEDQQSNVGDSTGLPNNGNNGNTLKMLNSIKLIDNIDNSLQKVYDKIISSDYSTQTLNNKIQNFEIADFSKTLNTAKKNLGGLSDTKTQDEETKEFLNASNNNLLGNINEFIVSTERKKRYQIYDEIPDLNYIAFRMLDVYIQNIFVKNIQTKKFLSIDDSQQNLIKNENKIISQNYISTIKTFLTYFEIENKLKNFIVPKALKYGNYFMEVINFENIENFINSNKLIQENYIESNSPLAKDIKKFSDIIIIEGYINKSDNNTILLENAFDNNTHPSMNESTFLNKLKSFLKDNKPASLLEENIFDFLNKKNEEARGDYSNNEDYDFEDLNKLDINKLKDIQIRGLDPSKVIIIEDETVLYGYLIVEDEFNPSGNEIDIYKRFLSDGSEKTTKNKGDGNEYTKDVIDRITKYVSDNVIELIRLSNHNFKFSNLKLPDDSIYSLKNILYNKIKEKSKLKFRFLSANNIVNFSAPINKYAPYGTSIFDPIVQPVKLYTLALISSIISRLSRASVVRKWNVEAGSKKNHAEIIETVKRDIKNKSITFDNLSNVKNIANVLTDFRDIATIKIDGQSFIDMEIVPMGDRSLPLNDLNDLRNDLIAATGIPSVYLNIGDQADLREQLVNLNTSFAQNILNWQSSTEEGLNKLLNIIFTELLKSNGKTQNTFSLNNFYSLKLTPPLILQVQSNEALISSITNIIGLFKSSEFVVDPKYLYKMFIPNIDWDALEESGKKFILAKGKEALIDQSANGM